ncbi:MAG TPA: hypothetical protein VGI39_37705 [Polyangiaceae bacterium]
MTWYANRIYVNASPLALAVLRAEPALRGHLFLLQGTLPTSWEQGGAELELAPGGLAVVKEIGPPASDETPAAESHEWYSPGERLSWDSLRGSREVAVMAPSIEELMECDRPPRRFLQFLAELRARCEQPVTYYLGRTWGGDMEGEAAWVFADRQVLYCHRTPDEVVVVDGDGRRLARGDVLRLALANHGLHLPTGYFAPHTRGFDWATRRLS